MNRLSILIAITCAILLCAVFFLQVISEHFGGKTPLVKNEISGEANISSQPDFQNFAQIEPTLAKREDLKEFALQICGKEIIVFLADTSEKRAKGLMGVDFLEENKGMLFIFYGEPSRTIENPGQFSFWNKNTLIPLDVVWIKDNKIIKIDYLPSIDKGLKILSSPGEIDRVLEANAGWTEKNNIKAGDEIKF